MRDKSIRRIYDRLFIYLFIAIGFQLGRFV